MMRRSDSHLDFDLDLAKRQSNENPSTTFQYATPGYRASEDGPGERLAIPATLKSTPPFSRFPEEIALIKAVIRYPEVVEAAARALEPHRLTFYLMICRNIHSYYNKNRVISEDRR